MKLGNLDNDEKTVIRIIRRWKDHPNSGAFDNVPVIAQEEISAFITFLWRIDSYVVNVGKVSEQNLRLFEVQLLYAISVQLAAKPRDVNEILDWWFPVSDKPAAQKSLSKIGIIFKALNISLNSAGWVHSYFLSRMARRVRFGSTKILRETFNLEDFTPLSVMIH
jgi:hypothetical protein